MCCNLGRARHGTMCIAGNDSLLLRILQKALENCQCQWKREVQFLITYALKTYSFGWNLVILTSQERFNVIGSCGQKGDWNIINLTLTLTRYYLYSNDLHVVMEWCPQKWNSQIEDTILLYSINEGKSSGSLHNLTWAYHHNEDILLRHWLRFANEVD